MMAPNQFGQPPPQNHGPFNPNGVPMMPPQHQPGHPGMEPQGRPFPPPLPPQQPIYQTGPMNIPPPPVGPNNQTNRPRSTTPHGKKDRPYIEKSSGRRAPKVYHDSSTNSSFSSRSDDEDDRYFSENESNTTPVSSYGSDSDSDRRSRSRDRGKTRPEHHGIRRHHSKHHPSFPSRPKPKVILHQQNPSFLRRNPQPIVEGQHPFPRETVWEEPWAEGYLANNTDAAKMGRASAGPGLPPRVIQRYRPMPSTPPLGTRMEAYEEEMNRLGDQVDQLIIENSLRTRRPPPPAAQTRSFSREDSPFNDGGGEHRYFGNRRPNMYARNYDADGREKWHQTQRPLSRPWSDIDEDENGREYWRRGRQSPVDDLGRDHRHPFHPLRQRQTYNMGGYYP